jgi:hypothetical protein
VLSNIVIGWKFLQRACELGFAMSGKEHLGIMLVDYMCSTSSIVLLTNCLFFICSSYNFDGDGLSASRCIGWPAWRVAAGYRFAGCWKFCVCIFFGGSRCTTGAEAGLVPREKLRTTGYSGPISPGGRVDPGAKGKKQLKLINELIFTQRLHSVYGEQ